MILTSSKPSPSLDRWMPLSGLAYLSQCKTSAQSWVAAARHVIWRRCKFCSPCAAVYTSGVKFEFGSNLVKCVRLYRRKPLGLQCRSHRSEGTQCHFSLNSFRGFLFRLVFCACKHTVFLGTLRDYLGVAQQIEIGTADYRRFDRPWRAASALSEVLRPCERGLRGFRRQVPSGLFRISNYISELAGWQMAFAFFAWMLHCSTARVFCISLVLSSRQCPSI